MKKKFNVEDYDDMYVMCCTNERDANTFCNALHKTGRSWVNGLLYENRSYWSNLNSKIYYDFSIGSYSYNKYEGKEILNFNDFDWEENNYDFVENEIIEVSEDKSFENSYEAKFKGYFPECILPFVVVEKNSDYLTTWMFARKLNATHKPFTEHTAELLELLGRFIVHRKDSVKFKLISLNSNKTVTIKRLDSFTKEINYEPLTISLKELFENYSTLSGNFIGKER